MRAGHGFRLRRSAAYPPSASPFSLAAEDAMEIIIRLDILTPPSNEM